MTKYFILNVIYSYIYITHIGSLEHLELLEAPGLYFIMGNGKCVFHWFIA